MLLEGTGGLLEALWHLKLRVLEDLRLVDRPLRQPLPVRLTLRVESLSFTGPPR